MKATRSSSIDLGTNTCLLLVKETDEGVDRILHDESTVVRLGEGVDQTGVLSFQAMERAETCIEKYAGIAKSFGVNPADIVAVGTSSSRDAKNSTLFYETIRNRTNIEFRVLSGDEEANATFLGAALPGMKIEKMVVMDIGGGSTELVAKPETDLPVSGESLDIGAVRMTERFLKSDPVIDDEFWQCEAFINESLKSMVPWRQLLREKMVDEPSLVCVAGTAVTLAMLQLGSVEYVRDQIDGVRITRGDVHRWVEELKWRTIQERKTIPGMESKRADVMLAGALIFWRVMEELDFQEAVISTRGLRYGVLLGPNPV